MQHRPLATFYDSNHAASCVALDAAALGELTGLVSDPSTALAEGAEAVTEAPQPLPGERSYDVSLLEQAVTDLNALYAVRGLDTARAVGRYVLSTFFNDDPEAFRGQGRQHVTFRGLAAREDLKMSYSFIWYSVAVLEQLSQLPEDVASALPLSHHRLLLPIEDLRLKEDLARQARDKGWSKRDLDRAIRELRGQSSLKKRSRGGRPPLPSFVKGLRQLEKAVTLATETEVSAAAVEGFTEERSKELLAKLYRQMHQLHELAEGLRLAIAGCGEADEEPEEPFSQDKDAVLQVAAK